MVATLTCQCGITLRWQDPKIAKIKCPNCSNVLLIRKHSVAERTQSQEQKEDELLAKYCSMGTSEEPVGYQQRSKTNRLLVRCMGNLRPLLPYLCAAVWIPLGSLVALGSVLILRAYVDFPVSNLLMGLAICWGCLGVFLVFASLFGLLGEDIRIAGALSTVLGILGIGGAISLLWSAPQFPFILSFLCYGLLLIAGIAGLLSED